ncbi:MAG: flagellar hook-length control protein FliK [Pseudomonadota bacterium]
MQTQFLPQVSGAAAASSAPSRPNANASGDGAQFSQALSREVEQRQSAPAPAPAAVKPQPAAARPQAAAPQAQQPAQVAAKAAGGGKAAAKADDGADEARDDAADAAAASPVADMLALVASFNQPAPVAAAPATDPLAAAAAALKGAEQVDFSARQIKADADAATLADALKGQALPPAADGKGLPFKELVQAAIVAPPIARAAPAAKPVEGDITLPPVMPVAEDTIHADKAPAGLAALTAGMTKTGDDDAAPVMTRAETALVPAALKAEAAPMRAREGVADIAAVKEPAVSAPVSAPVQQASLAMAQAVGAAPAERIAARVGTPAWDNQVGQKIVWMVAGKEQSATLTLNPPDMGPMQVVLNVTNDQATISFTAAQPEVRQALENAMPKLREMMSENGIALGNASVNEGSAEQRQAQQGEKSRGQGGNRFGNGGDAAGAAEAPRAVRSGGTGLVDTFA